VFQNNRVGDFDIFAMLKLGKQGLSVEQVLKKLGSEGGLLGVSGVSNDVRDIEKAAAAGNTRAQLAIDAFVEGIRHYIGSYLVALGGCDVLAFSGGIGENDSMIRRMVCKNMAWAGIELDEKKNEIRGREEKISSVESNVEIWVIPTNEELIVAQQTEAVLLAN
jgi:acetate kinase